MLKQEINLYRPFEMPTPDIAFITWRQFLLGNAAMFFLLLLFYVMMLFQLYYLNHERETLAAERLTLQQKFYASKSKYPSLFFSQDVQQTLQQMEKIIAAQSKFFSAISHPAPFSEKLIGLSNIDLPNVWLTDISISNIEKKTILKGNTNSTNDLETYLASLSRLPIFANSTITMNDIESNEKTNRVIL